MSETQTYLVEWQMHVEADNPATAARQAWEHVRRKDSTATVFDVVEDSGEKIRVDLMELEEWNQPAEPSPVEAISQAKGAIASLMEQIEQMRGMFDDADGTIAAALQDGDEAQEMFEALKWS